MNTRSDAFDFDLVILGGGASGLLLADQLLRDSFYAEHRILLIEKDQKNSDDRTWCYWEAGEGRFDKLLHKVWDTAVFRTKAGERTFSLAPYRYKMLRSSRFYKYVHRRISESTHMELLQDEVVDVTDTGKGVRIRLSEKEIFAKKCFSSIRDLSFLHHHKHFPLLQQHFTGWFIETETPAFDANTATLMDFSVPQKGNTRFMYVLPESSKKALLEYTLFSPDILEPDEYEDAIKEYLQKVGISNYRILEKETGNIPMSAYPFHLANSRNLMYIGTAGGWTKASTGYTFHNSLVKVQQLVAYLKNNDDLSDFKQSDRFDFYDRVFLEVLYYNNDLGAELFGRMFIKGDPVTNLKFLDNETSFHEELSILKAMPKGLFVRNALKILV